MNRDIDVKESARDYSILFKVLDLSHKQAAEIAANSASSKTRIEAFRHDISGFLKYYFPEYISLEPAAFQKAIFSILENPVQNRTNGRWQWKVTEEQASLLSSYHRREFRNIPKQVDALRAIAMCAPREMGKSTIFGRLLIIWMALYGYVKYIVYFRSSEDLADQFLRDTMAEFEDNPRLIKDFGNMKGSVWKEGMYSLKNGCVFASLGRGASVRGLVNRSRRPDLIILDDLTTDKDKKSATLMDSIYDWIFSAITGLSKNSLILYLNTIFNEMDPMSRVQKRIESNELPTWFGLRLSAEIDDEHALWPEYWPLEDLHSKRMEIGSIRYNIEHMSIIPDASNKIIPSSILKFVPETQIDIHDYDIHFGVDPNAGGSDDSAIAVVGRSLTTGKYLTIDAWEKDGATITELVDQLVRWNSKYHPSLIAWEQVAFQKVYGKLLQEILLAQFIALPMIGVPADGSKEQRAMGLYPFLENGSWIHSEKLRDSRFMYKVTVFPQSGINDGAVDAWGYAFRSFMENAGTPVGHAGKRDSSLPGLIGRYRSGF